MRKILFGLALVGGCTGSARADLILTAAVPTATVTFETYTGAGFSAGTGTTGVGTGTGTTAGTIDSSTFATTGMSDGATAFGATATTGDFARGIITTAGPNVTTGGFYALATGGNTAFGFQPSANDFTPGTITARITNSTGQSLSGFNVGYDIFYRNNESFSSSFNFSYSTDGSTFIPVNTLDFATPAMTTNDTAFTSINRSTNVTGLNIANNTQFFFRFSTDDASGSGSRDELGFDNLSVTGAVATPEPETWAMMVMGVGALALFGWKRKRNSDATAIAGELAI